MTRQCGWCGKSLGPEKCPECGAEGVAVALAEVLVCTGPEQHVFTPGQGGVSHGICADCLANANAGAAGGVL